jgi:hypothetical protein
MSADGRMATGAAWLQKKKTLTRKIKEEKPFIQGKTKSKQSRA